AVQRSSDPTRHATRDPPPTRHNPEFTMLEFYTAYKDVNWMMDFCEEMLRSSIERVASNLQVNFDENVIDFSSFQRRTMKEAIAYPFREVPESHVTTETLNDPKV